jgi:hypothetical protein
MNETTERALKELQKNGYSILPNVLSAERCDQLGDVLDRLEERLSKEQPELVADHFGRSLLFNAHLYQPDDLLELINIPEVMAVVHPILGENCTLTTFNAGRSTRVPEFEGHNVHIDARIPVARFEDTFQVLVMICIDDFTEANGSTYVWPGSHTSGVNPKTQGLTEYPPGRVAIEAPKGSVFLFLSQLWHDVGTNISGDRRWGVTAYYSAWWVKPYCEFTLCGPEIFSMLSTEQKVLMGFNSLPPRPFISKRMTTCFPADKIPSRYEDALK